jgi:hypothetical protein
MTKGEGKGKFFVVLKFGSDHEGVWLTGTLDTCIFELDALSRRIQGFRP